MKFLLSCAYPLVISPLSLFLHIHSHQHEGLGVPLDDIYIPIHDEGGIDDELQTASIATDDAISIVPAPQFLTCEQLTREQME